MSLDKLVHPLSDSEVSDSESPHVKLLRLETYGESDEGGRNQPPVPSDDEWKEVHGKRNRRPRQKTAAATSTPASTAASAAFHESRPTPPSHVTASSSAASTASTTSPGVTATTSAPGNSTSAQTILPDYPSHPGEPAQRRAATAPISPKIVVPPTPGLESVLDLAEALEELLGTRLRLKFLESCSFLACPPTEEIYQQML